jgi:hypothetical protein
VRFHENALFNDALLIDLQCTQRITQALRPANSQCPLLRQKWMLGRARIEVLVQGGLKKVILAVDLFTEAYMGREAFMICIRSVGDGRPSNMATRIMSSVRSIRTS